MDRRNIALLVLLGLLAWQALQLDEITSRLETLAYSVWGDNFETILDEFEDQR